MDSDQELIYRSTRLSTEGRAELDVDTTRALRKAEHALQLWPANPDAEEVLLEAAARGGLYRRFPTPNFVRDLAFYAGSLITAGHELIRFDLASGEELWRVEPEAATAVCAWGEELALGCLFGEVFRIDPETGAHTELTTLEGTIVSLQALPEGELLAVGGTQALALGRDGSRRVLAEWEDSERHLPDEARVSAGGVLFARNGMGVEVWESEESGSARSIEGARRFALHPSDERVLLAPAWGPAKVGLLDGRTQTTPRAPTGAPITAAAWLDEERCLTGNAQGRLVCRLPRGSRDLTFFLGAAIQRLAVEPESGLVGAVVAGEKAVRLLSPDRGGLGQARCPVDHYNMRFGANGPEGAYAALGKDEEVQLFDGEGNHLHTLAGGERTSLKLRFHGDRLYGAADDCALRCWSLETGELLRTWRQPDAVVEDWKDEGWAEGVHRMSRNSSSMAFVAPSPNRELILSGSPGGPAQVWRHEEDQPFLLLPADLPKPESKYRPAVEDGAWLDESRFVVRGRWKAYLGDLEGGWLQRFGIPETPCGGVGAQGDLLASLHGKQVCLWSLTSGELLRQVDLAPLFPTHLAWAADGALRFYAHNRDERGFFRLEPEGELERRVYPLANRPEWVGWESSGDFAWVAIPKEGLFRVPLTARAVLASTNAASAAELGL